MRDVFIPYGRQDISEDDITAVTEVLRSDWLTQGPILDRFEQTVAKYCGAKYAVAVCNATAALHIACCAINLCKEDILWTTPNTFLASANCGRYCGADIDFVDIDPKTYNMSVECLELKLQEAEKKGILPNIVIPVHFSGQSCEMKKIFKLSQKYNFKIIEDASHAIGGEYLNSKVGCCEFSDMAVFSFHPVKIITTGEGGMVLTNNKELYEKLLLFRCHGMTRKSSLMTEPSHGPWYYQQIELGFNYRLTDIHAVLGLSQIKRLDEFIEKRHHIADIYNNELKNLPITLPFQHNDTYSAYHLYVIRLNINELSKTHKQIFEQLRGNNIGVNLHYIPVHLQPYYQKLGFKKGDFPEAEKYYSEAISIPMYFGLNEKLQDRVIKTLKKIII